MCHRDVSRELGRIQDDLAIEANSVRALELERLDSYLLVIARDVQKGDLAAIDRALKISERRAKLLGIDAAIDIKVSERVNAEMTCEINLMFNEIEQSELLSSEHKRHILN